jgi:hypothetical protein
VRTIICILVFGTQLLAAGPADINFDLHRVKQAPPAYSAPTLRSAQYKPSDLAPWLGYGAVLGSNVADVETSQAALRSCQSLCREANPLARNRWVGYGVGIPFDTLGFYWARKYHRYQGHGKSWILPTVLGLGVHGFGMYMNLRSMGQVNRELETYGRARR